MDDQSSHRREGRLADRVVLITGGCGDIGRATANACAREGAVVVLADVLSEDAARDVLAEHQTAHALYLSCNVRERPSVQHLIAVVEERHGGPDVVIANAGITSSAPALSVSLTEWQDILDVNLTGAFHVAQEGAAALVRQGRPGALLFTGSWVGDVPSKGLLPYCVSKAGVQMLARCLALEAGPTGHPGQRGGARCAGRRRLGADFSRVSGTTRAVPENDPAGSAGHG